MRKVFREESRATENDELMVVVSPPMWTGKTVMEMENGRIVMKRGTMKLADDHDSEDVDDVEMDGALWWWPWGIHQIRRWQVQSVAIQNSS